MIGQRLEDREIADVLVVEPGLQLDELLGHELRGLGVAHGLVRDQPEQSLGFGPIVEAQHSQAEQRLRLVAVFDRIVVVLAIVLHRHGPRHLGQILHDLRLVARQARRIGAYATDHAPHVGDQHRVVGDEHAPRLADDPRRGDLLLLADLVYAEYHVVGVFLDAVVHRGVRRGPGAVVVNAQPTSDVEVANIQPHLAQLGIDAAGLEHRVLDLADLGHLAADVEVEQHDTLHQARLPQLFESAEQLVRGQAELRRKAAGFFPHPRAAGLQSDAKAQRRHRIVRLFQNPVQLERLLDHHHDALAQSRGHGR